jgi:hypothetical protein
MEKQGEMHNWGTAEGAENPSFLPSNGLIPANRGCINPAWLSAVQPKSIMVNAAKTFRDMASDPF